MTETGMRASELIALKVSDVDLTRGLATVYWGKGGKGRIVPFGAQTATAIDRYLRSRRGHVRADSPELRHTAATRWLAAGGSEGGLMAVAGWARRDMIDRYTAATASERAATEARGLALGDL